MTGEGQLDSRQPMEFLARKKPPPPPPPPPPRLPPPPPPPKHSVKKEDTVTINDFNFQIKLTIGSEEFSIKIQGQSLIAKIGPPVKLRQTWKTKVSSAMIRSLNCLLCDTGSPERIEQIVAKLPIQCLLEGDPTPTHILCAENLNACITTALRKKSGTLQLLLHNKMIKYLDAWDGSDFDHVYTKRCPPPEQRHLTEEEIKKEPLDDAKTSTNLQQSFPALGIKSEPEHNPTVAALGEAGGEEPACPVAITNQKGCQGQEPQVSRGRIRQKTTPKEKIDFNEVDIIDLMSSDEEEEEEEEDGGDVIRSVPSAVESSSNKSNGTRPANGQENSQKQVAELNDPRTTSATSDADRDRAVAEPISEDNTDPTVAANRNEACEDAVVRIKQEPGLPSLGRRAKSRRKSLKEKITIDEDDIIDLMDAFDDDEEEDGDATRTVIASAWKFLQQCSEKKSSTETQEEPRKPPARKKSPLKTVAKEEAAPFETSRTPERRNPPPVASTPQLSPEANVSIRTRGIPAALTSPAKGVEAPRNGEHDDDDEDDATIRSTDSLCDPDEDTESENDNIRESSTDDKGQSNSCHQHHKVPVATACCRPMQYRKLPKSRRHEFTDDQATHNRDTSVRDTRNAKSCGDGGGSSRTYKVGDRAFTLHGDGREYPVKVLKVNEDTQTCRIRYIKYGTRSDKTLSFDELRDWSDKKFEEFHKTFLDNRNKDSKKRERERQKEYKQKKQRAQQRRKQQEVERAKREEKRAEEDVKRYGVATSRENLSIPMNGKVGQVLDQRFTIYNRFVYLAEEDETPVSIASKFGLPLDKLLFDNRVINGTKVSTKDKFRARTPIVIPTSYQGKLIAPPSEYATLPLVDIADIAALSQWTIL